MDLALTAVITALLVGVLAGGLSFYLRGALITRGQEAARAAAEQQIRRADARSKEILLEAREHGIKTRTALEAETRAERQELQRLETRVEQREETLEKRAGALEERDRSLERLQEQRFDLIFIDLVMPEMDGARTFREIRKVDPDANVMIVTAYPNSALMFDVLQVGPFGMMKKPFTLDELHRVLGYVEEGSGSVRSMRA